MKTISKIATVSALAAILIYSSADAANSGGRGGGSSGHSYSGGQHGGGQGFGGSWHHSGGYHGYGGSSWSFGFSWPWYGYYGSPYYYAPSYGYDYDYYPPPTYYYPPPVQYYNAPATVEYHLPAPPVPNSPDVNIPDNAQPEADRPLPPSAVYKDPAGFPPATPSRTQPQTTPPQPRSTPAAQSHSMGLADVKALVKAGVADEVIISQIRNARVTYHLTTAEIIDLKETGVSNKILECMVNTASR